MERAPGLLTAQPDAVVPGEPPVPAGPSRGRRRILLGLALVLLAVLTLALWLFATTGPAPLTQGDVDRAVASGIDQAQQDQRNAPADATTAYRKIQPSLVTVTTTGKDKQSGLGAGAVINADGSVLTALHVVSGATSIRVRFADGTQATAAVTDRQPDRDLAVLGVDRLPGVIVPAVLGGGVQVGDAVFAVGNPLGLQGTLTSGVVSALDRRIRTQDTQTLKQLIQFDAAVNPGNSGGPLLDRDGQVVGVVTALANPSKEPYFIGIGFAVPLDTAGGAAGGPSK